MRLVTYESPVGDVIALLEEVTLFAALPASGLAELARGSRTRVVAAGEWLFRQGEQADALYVVRSGRLEVVVETPPPTRTVQVVGRGAILGELALVTNATRSASVRAHRDSEVVTVTRAGFADLVDGNAKFAMALIRLLGEKLQLTEGLSQVRTVPPTVVVLVAAATSHLAEVRSGIIGTLSSVMQAVALDDPGGDDTTRARALDEAERRNDLVLLTVADPAGAWARFCVRQADRAAVVVDAGRHADTPHWPTATALIDLVTIGPAHAREIALWEQTMPCRARHVVHLGAGFNEGITRLARRLVGRSPGVVLSGGGARAFAHIGVLEVLTDAGVIIDRVGGCSMGAFIGALFASGCPPGEIRELCQRELVTHNPFRDVTVPRVALIKGRNARSMLARTFSGRNIEELTLDYFCVSADLVSADVVVHRQGLVADAVAASMSMPGIAPPVADNGRLLIDGGVLDNLPVDVMAATGEGPVIAVDVMGRGRDGHFAGLPSAGRRLPGIVDTLARATVLGSWRFAAANRHLASATITPKVGDIALLDFTQLDHAIEQGRRAAHTALDTGTLLHP
ncbi:MAG: patatin-like phospholipase family protein [Ilumatobacteraceae bacterium]